MVEEVGAECRALSEEIAELYRAQDKLRDECTRSKQDNHAAKDKVAKAVAMLKQAEVTRRDVIFFVFFNTLEFSFSKSDI